GLTMTRKLADLLGLQRGDTVLMRPVKGLRQTHEVTVTNISDSYVGLSVYANIDYLSRLIGEEVAITGVQLQTDPRSVLTTAMLKAIKDLSAVQTYSARRDAIQNLIEPALKAQMFFIVLLSLFAGIIFFCSMLNTSLISLAERRREVATLRVIGYTEYQIGGYFLRESMLVNSIGTLLGLPLGYALTVWLVLVRFPTQI